MSNAKSNFKKGDKVVKVLIGGGVETAVLATVASVKKDGVRLIESHQVYDSESFREIDPPISGFTTRLIVLEQ